MRPCARSASHPRLRRRAGALAACAVAVVCACEPTAGEVDVTAPSRPHGDVGVPSPARPPPVPRGEGEGESELGRDEVIEAFARDLMSNPHVAAASDARLVARDGALVLVGAARTATLRAEIERYAEALAGHDVVNELEVRAP